MSDGYVHREGSGSIFTNKRKEKDSHPDWTGKIMVNGTLCYLSGWWKGEGQDSFISLSIGKAVEQKDERPAPRRGPPSRGRDPGLDYRNDDNYGDNNW